MQDGEQEVIDKLIQEQLWEQAQQYLQAHPHLCQSRTRRHGRTLLHMLCSQGATPPALIELCAQLYPEAISLPDTYFGDTALHILCRNCQTSSRKLSLLLQYNCGDVSIRNRLGGTCLHSLCNHNGCLDAIIALVNYAPNLLNVRTHETIHCVTALWMAFVQTIPGTMVVAQMLNNGQVVNNSPFFERFWTKVEYLCVQYYDRVRTSNDVTNHGCAVVQGLLRCDVPIKLLRVCFLYKPSYARQADHDSNYPLHYIMEHRPYRLSEPLAIESCVRAAPEAIVQRNHAGDLPLHIGIRNKVPFTCSLSVLVHEQPQTLSEPDRITGLFPFLLAALQGESALVVNTTFELLRRQPDVLVQARNDRDG